MQPATAEASIRQRYEETNGGEVCVSFRLAGRAVREGTDSSVLFVDKVDEIRVAIVKARGKRLVLDHTIQFDCKQALVSRTRLAMLGDTRSGIARFHAIV